MPSSRTTIKDVARAAGVHYSTVSLALRNSPSISEPTRKKIREAAEKIGYNPDPVYSALSRFRHLESTGERMSSPHIAYVVNRSPELGFDRCWYQREFLDGATAQARALGYELELHFLGDDYHSSASLEAYLHKHSINGIIMGAFEPGFPGLHLNWDDFAVVKIDSLHIPPAVTFVSNDQMQVARVACQKLREFGYERLGLAIGRADEEGTNYRYTAGWLIEHESQPRFSRIPPLLFPHNAPREVVVGLVARWVRRHQIDAIMCNWSNILSIAQDAGFKVPQDLACAGLCLSEQNDPALAGVVPNLKVVGARAVSQLATLLRSGLRGTPEVAPATYIQGYWRDGASAPAKVKTT